MALDSRRPYTPETLAERWACSAETIRAMCRTGRLTCFRVGKGYRIPYAVVEAHESAGQPNDKDNA